MKMAGSSEFELIVSVVYTESVRILGEWKKTNDSKVEYGEPRGYEK